MFQRLSAYISPFFYISIEKSRMPDFPSPSFPTHHEFDIRALVRLVPVSGFFQSFLLCPETVSSNNTDNAVAFSSHHKPLFRRRSPLITQYGLTKEKSHRLTHAINVNSFFNPLNVHLSIGELDAS
jgi:hypothetical protein